MGQVVDEEKEVALSSLSYRSHRITEVIVLELQPLLSSEARLTQERSPLLLCQHASFIELLHMVDLGDLAHHPLDAELLQHLEVQVPEPLVPPPSLSQ